MNKRQLQSEQTKKKVAGAARSLFAQKGYKGTSIEDIVEATECSKGNIYYHFKSKEGLFLYLLDEWDLEWHHKWEAQEGRYETSVDKLYALAESLVAEDFNHPLTQAADEFFNQEEKTNEVDQRFTELTLRHLQFNQRFLREGIERGEFAADHTTEHLAIILESLLLGLGQVARRACRADEASAVYRTAVHVMLNGIKQRN